MRNCRAFAALPIAAAALISTGCASPSPVSGFRPLYPEVTHSLFRQGDIRDLPNVDSLQPTLRWQEFPGEHQQFPGGKVFPFVAADSASVRNVTYDLRIWAVRGRMAGDLVYEIGGLTEPSHKLEKSLKPDAEYYWSVRARFDLDGQPRVSEWSLMQIPCPPPYGVECARGVARQTGNIPAPNHYRFKTPPQ